MYYIKLYLFAIFSGLLSAYRLRKISFVNKNSNFIQKATISEVELNLGELINSKDFVKKFASKKVTGVYAVADVESQVQYVGISRNVSSSIETLLNIKGNELVNSVRVQTFSIPSLSAMEAYKTELIRQLGLSTSTEKLMEWDNILSLSVDEIKESKVISFEFGDSISSNIINKNGKTRKSLKDVLKESQQQELLSSSTENKNQDSNIISPFTTTTSSTTPTSTETVIRSSPMVGLGGGLDFTKENINKVLEEVRPFLIADGGNVAIASIDEDSRSISLILEGACGSCPSSTTTMKMGIERVLRENFVNLGEILAVNPPEPVSELTTEKILEALNPVMPAIKAMGGQVEVLEVDSINAVVKLKYKGPVKLRQGVELILKDLKYVQTVEIESF